MNLPVYEVQNDLLESLQVKQAARVLLKAPTGSGKSTAVPQMLLDADLAEGLIVVVQPRRIAARMLARRVASLRKGAVGGEVGYVVRFDRKMSVQTRIVYVTDGVLSSWLEEGNLENVSAVIFDEFHERRLASDLSLSLCLDLQESERPDLKVVVMSATLELEGLGDYLGSDCAVIEANGRSFPVDVCYQGVVVQSRGQRRDDAVWDRCAAAVKELIADQIDGHILVFLPGVYEIRRAVELIERSSWSRGWNVCPLYSALSPERQDAAVLGDSNKPRIIVSTNVAETSLTIDGVRAVVDAGLARVSHYDALRGMSTLNVQKISRAAAEQRAGRAGRTGPGKCIRLWSENDHGRRLAFELPEVQRVDLSETLLQLKLRGVREVRDFRWLECPNENLLEHAESLLLSLKAVEADGSLSDLGKKMAAMRLHPRFSRLLIAAEREGCLAEAQFIAACVQGEGIFLRNGDGRKAFAYEEDASDFVGEWRGFLSALQMKFDRNRCQQIGVMAKGAREVSMAMRQIAQQCERLGMVAGDVDFEGRSREVSRAMLRAFSDQLAIKTSATSLACRLVGERRGKLDSASVVAKADAFVVTELTEVAGKDVQVHLNRCVGVWMEDLEAIFPAEFRDVAQAFYDEKIRRVVQRQTKQFRDLVISCKDSGDPDLDAAAMLLAERVASGELKLKKWDASVEQWIARLLSLREWMPELELPGFDEEDRQFAFEQICQGALGYKDIKDRPVMPALRGWLSAAQTAALDHYAPERIKLANGKETKLRYEYGSPPTMAMQVQRLFGVNETPTISDGKVKVLVHLCAPNQRPWQMTQDLKGFWESGFEQMRKDLAGRYPKHQWELPR